MGYEDVMRKNIGKKIIWENEEVEIVGNLTCYDGDFYDYKKPDGTIRSINVNTDEGRKFSHLVFSSAQA